MQSSTMEMQMSQMYDEDLLENSFLQQFCEMCPPLFQSAIANEWLICVPKVGTFEQHELTEQDCLSHVLIRVTSSQYKTASDKHVLIKDRIIYLGEGFDKHKKVDMLFSETFYSDNQKKYQVCCVSQPFSFDATTHQTSAHAHLEEFKIKNVEDAMELLFIGTNQSLKRSIDKYIAAFKVNLGCDADGRTPTLRMLIDKMHTLFSHCVRTAGKDSKLRKKIHNQGLEQHLKLAIEIYINHSLYNSMFKYICTAVVSEDAKLNKINRNLSQIQLKDLGIKTEFSENIPRARKELLLLPSFTTPLAKMACIKRAIVALMQAPRAKAKEAEPLTADDLLPMLVFLIIRSSIANWMANFRFMMEFNFSKSFTQDHSFYLSQFEAALVFVQSGELNKSLTATNEQEKNLSFSTTSSPARSSPISLLFEGIHCGCLETVRDKLEQENTELEDSTGSSKCHPLCSCDKCEKRNDMSSQAASVTLHSRDDRGYTALHQAALTGHPQIVEYLISQGADIDSSDYHGSTPLHVACQKGQQNSAMMLIYHGSDVNSADNDGNRPLHLAALNGHEDCVKALIFQASSNRLDINAANENGDTALHLAVKWSYESITKLLLDNGASAEARNRHKYTPMRLASDERIVALLQAAIENAQEQANDGFIEVIEPSSPVAAIPIMSDCSQILVDTPILQSPRKVSTKVKKLLKAVTDSDIEMVKHLMGWSYKADSSEEEEEADVELCHPLCQCRRCAPTQKVKASLEDMNSCDEQGRTALHIAVERSNIDIIKLLLSKHVEVNYKTDQIQFTPLHIASQQLNPNSEIISLLIQHGARVNCKDCNSRTPLHFASQTGSVDTTRQLLQAGANIHAVNIKGNTPLHEAAKVNNCEIVELLLKYGASPNISNKNGLRPIQLTSESDIVAVLTDAIDNTHEDAAAEKSRALSTLSVPIDVNTSSRSPSTITQSSLCQDELFNTPPRRTDTNAFLALIYAQPDNTDDIICTYSQAHSDFHDILFSDIVGSDQSDESEKLFSISINPSDKNQNKNVSDSNAEVDKSIDTEARLRNTSLMSNSSDLSSYVYIEKPECDLMNDLHQDEPADDQKEDSCTESTDEAEPTDMLVTA